MDILKQFVMVKLAQTGVGSKKTIDEIKAKGASLMQKNREHQLKQVTQQSQKEMPINKAKMQQLAGGV